ncbi:hypothetical protein [Selenomonas ruminantium]|uniref:Uncharacterized protein n=1 Tax=Selenomonas ruminantium TaxID=971 RepID=A0A1I0WJH0_SELRU|nr:hypothetical protein [Selenomonas ruminantium]SFA88915.1 hypothetical protein SAMN05216587_10350 [Selenomonas ruminantium]
MDIFMLIVGYAMIGSAIFLLLTKILSYIPSMHKEFNNIPIGVWFGLIVSLIITYFFIDVSVK